MTTRRTFLQHAALLTAGAFLAPSALLAKPTQKVGIQLYTLREQISKDVKGVIGKVAKAGYNEVETYGYSLKNKFWGLEPKAFKQLLSANKLTAPSGHFGFDDYIGAGKDDDLKAYIDAAKAVDMKYVVVPYLGDKLRQSASDYQRIAERLNTAAEACKRAGLGLAYHNHDFEFQKFDNTTGYDILLNETDKDLVKFELDLYWVVRADLDPVTMFNANPGRFVMWHVKDMDKANPKLNTEVGSGSVNFRKIFDQASQSGVEHIFVEQENFAIDPFKSINQSYAYVKKNLLS
ncbi:sugar phosphate isomerase/epimerase [Pontibacter qinzhouensis]|uniref:Sugar phosphate isomerase/epimerase n=1 Tax=Pontibacter qinzhouensis TaxID=2603253 RepID=A0A5C8KB62_9BACT|nr:sugar phosphate isomerase/epimerase [Pontibacter qinzhouensis]TXK49376.1 sugar phosphate isomerase/epimerase [Pontibacter qinzhouensis]